MEVRAPDFEPEQYYLFVNRNNHNGVSRIFEFKEQRQGIYIFSLIETRHPGKPPMVPTNPLELRGRIHELDVYYITELQHPNASAAAAGGKRKNRSKKRKTQKTKSKKRKTQKTKSKKRKNKL